MAAAIVLLAGTTGAAIAAFQIRQSDDPMPNTTLPSRALLEGYESAISEPAKRGGFVIQMGLKSGLGQVANDQAGPVVFQAVEWARQLEAIRAEFNAEAARVRGTTLEKAANDFDASLRLYIRTAETIGAAAIASGQPRETLIDKAAELGRQADARYDTASAVLQDLRHRHGLPPTSRFPS